MGKVWSSDGTYKGHFSGNGEFYDDHGDYVGRIDKDGYIYDYSGNYKGSVWSNGHIYMNGEYVGLIDSLGDIYMGGTRVGHVDGYRKDAGHGNSTSSSSGRTTSSNSSSGSAGSSSGSGVTEIGAGVAEGVASGLSIEGCGVAFIFLLGGLIVFALAVIVFSFGIAIAGTGVLVAWIIYKSLDFFTKGSFSKRSDAKVLSGVAAAVIMVVLTICMYNAGYLAEYIGSPQRKVVYEPYDDETGEYEPYDDTDDTVEEDEDDTGVVVEDGDDYILSDNSPFYGIWCKASKEYSKAEEFADYLTENGIDAYIVDTSEWNNLNAEPWYAVTAGTFDSENEADDELSTVKDLYSDAYVKYSGDRYD